MTVIATTPRLRLRQLTEADASLLRGLNANLNVCRFVGDGPLADDAAALAVIRTRILPQYREHGVGRWAVERLSDGAFLGWCGLKRLADAAGYDLGYRFFEEHWGHGYATEAARATLAWAAAHLPEARIVAEVHPENARSVHVLTKLGLRFVRHEGESTAWYELPR